MISGILLAAGAGVRFGGRKLLYPLPDGTPLGLASSRNLRAATGRTLAVVRPGDLELAQLLRAEGMLVIECADARLGLGHSLAAAVAHEADAAGWIIALGDMPYVSAGTIARVARELTDGADIAVPVFAGQRGHPVGFSQVYREELMGLRGDSGARSILARNAVRIRHLEVEDEGILLDVDTRADVQRLERPAERQAR